MKSTSTLPVAFAWVCMSLISSQAGVYDDTAAWWHLDYDPDHDPGGLNAAQLSDIRDQRDWGTTAAPGANGRNATAIGGEFGGPLWTNAPVVCPAGGRTYGGLSLSFPQVTNSLGQIKQDTVFFSGFRLGGSSTIVTRFLWDGRFFAADRPDWIYNNSLAWGEKLGWIFGVRHDGGHRLGMWIGTTAVYGAAVESNKWYDAAAVITDNGDNDTVELFLWPAGGTLQYSKWSGSAVTNAVGAGGGVIGCESAPSTAYSAVTENAGKCFKGLLNHIALWDRALSYDEVLEAFCFPQPLIQVGLDNGTTAELRPEQEAATVFSPNAPWHTFPRAVSTGRPEVTLNIPLTALQANLNYLFHLKTALSEGGQPSKLLLRVNGQANTARETLRASPGQDLYWPIAKGRLVTGMNTFTLTLAAGPAAWTSFDFLELGGAWQLGIDNNSAGEFVAEATPYRNYWVTDTNWTHLARAVTFQSTNTVIHFNLTSQLVDQTDFTFTTRIVSQGGANPTG
ncbi:MAG: LamG domain-containing protein, partial [Verrucomicrobiota bacterium]|nr:LamG domain-containing protein [Verrucomicrobiota bacterium]